MRILCQRLGNQDIRWVLVGSTSLALQGVDVTPGDIDILTDEAGSHKINDLLKDRQVRPVEYRPSDAVRSHWGGFLVNDVRVEVMGDYREKVQGKRQDFASRLTSPLIVQAEGMQLPVSSLQDQFRSYELGARDTDTAKIEAIRAVLKKRRTATK